MVESIRKRVAEALAALGVGEDARVGVGCSGGPDSAVLADATLALRSRGALGPVTLLYVDHGLRAGTASEAALVERLARGAGFACLSVTVDRGASLEDAARRARYAAFEQAARDYRLDVVLLAHTASDQAETVLMRILRGSGVAGLAAIPSRRGRYCRPLLTTTRTEIDSYVAAAQLEVVQDSMNGDSRFFRVRVRKRWLPELANENPALESALCRLASAAREQVEVLAWAVEAALASARRDGALELAALAQVPPAVANAALARAAEDAGLGPLTARHRQALATLGRVPAAGSAAVSLPRGTAVREYDRLRFVLGGGAPNVSSAAAPLVNVHGDDGPYLVRKWQSGDRMRPARLVGRSRKLSDLFIDAKIPRGARASAVVVTRVADGEIAWAEHIGPAFGSGIRVTLTHSAATAINKVSD